MHAHMPDPPLPPYGNVLMFNFVTFTVNIVITVNVTEAIIFGTKNVPFRDSLSFR